jgi:subtilisin family serine protease
MNNKKYLKKLFATMMTSAILTVPSFNAIANNLNEDSPSGKNGSTANENLEAMNVKASKGKHVITLITGDVVTVTELADGKNVINVEPADRANGGARILTANKNIYVIPDQAMPYLASGFLDQDLFNVTQLIADGYDDANNKNLPVIVQYEESKTRTFTDKPTPKGSKKTHVLESINGVALSADKKDSKQFWQDITQGSQQTKSSKTMLAPGIEKIWLDGRVEAALEQSVSQINAPEAWESGFDGTGVKVAVLDTGIDTEHPDVASQLEEAKSFVPGEDALDRHAHGTHVASTVLGTGDASEGRYKGVAPGADLLVGKVLSDEGFGQDSWIIDGMEWAAENAKIVSMSLGSSEPSDGTDPMAQAVNELSEETGALFVIAAGNNSSEGSIGSPGAADAALTVGAVDKSDNLAWFSSQGPRYGDQGLKPDLTAPGVAITAARSHLSQGTGSYISMNGTSMATPHVAGAAAILAQRHPDWAGAQLKDALMSTTKKLDHIKPYQGGTGRLDVAAATFGTVTATGSLDFGFFDWPHNENDSVKKTVTYSNASEEEVTLDISVDFTDSNGSPAPAGMLQVSAEKITIPAKSNADIQVSLDPKLGAFGARYQGQITAASEGQTVVHTSVGMIKEDERYSLTLKATDRDGSENSAYAYLLGENMPPKFISINGTSEFRLPKGTYSVMAMMKVDEETDYAGVALVGNPEIILDNSKTVELDARKAKEVTVDVPLENEATYRKLEYYRSIGDNSVNDIYLIPVMADKMYAQPTEEVKDGKFTLATRWRLAEPYLTINSQGTLLDDIPQAGSTLFEGTHNLKAVFAGEGTPADYQGLDVKGKAVIVQRSKEISGSERAAAALAAEAKLLITVNDGPQELSEWVGIENEDYSLSDIPIAVAGVSGTEGEKLVEAAKTGMLTLNVKGTPNPSYIYDLVDMHHNAIPEDLTYSPKTQDLVKIDTQYKSDRPAPGSEFRYDILTHSHHGVGFQQRISLPSVRTEWVSAQEGTNWYHGAAVLDDEWEIRQPVATYEPGQRLKEQWFAPVVRPRLGEGFWVPYRTGNSFVLNLPAYADSGAGNTGADMTYPGEQTIKFYQEDKLVEDRKGQAVYSFKQYPTENTKYRVVTDAYRNPERWNTSTSTHTEWTFWSKQQEEFRTDLPLISLDYKVETDMTGNASAGRLMKLGLSAVQIPGAPGNGAMEGATLEVSFDEGKTWEKTELQKDGEGWTADIKHPNKPGSYVSLRASAWDDAGNSITQEVIKAYGLR